MARALRSVCSGIAALLVTLLPAQVQAQTPGCIVGWGPGIATYMAPPEGSKWVEVSAGEYFAIARDTEGHLRGWGNNAAGQNYPTTGKFTAVSAGYTHAMALRDDGAVLVWGSPISGTPPGTDFGASAIAAGEGWCLALKGSNGSLYAWGVGVVATAASNAGTGFVEIAAGAHCFIARRACGEIFVYAIPGYHECESVTPYAPSPTVIPDALENENVVAVAAGHCTVYALTEDGEIFGWGGGGGMICGQRTGIVEPQYDGGYIEVVGGYVSAAARRSNGTMVAWGAVAEPICPNCCLMQYGQGVVPAALSQVVGLRLAKGHSTYVHFAIVPSCP